MRTSKKFYRSRTGHASPERYFKFPDATDPIPKFDRASLLEMHCLPCKIAKMQRAPVKSSTQIISKPIELVDFEISGNLDLSICGAMYTFAFLDDYTATSYVSLSKKESELLQALEMYKNMA